MFLEVSMILAKLLKDFSCFVWFLTFKNPVRWFFLKGWSSMVRFRQLYSRAKKPRIADVIRMFHWNLRGPPPPMPPRVQERPHPISLQNKAFFGASFLGFLFIPWMRWKSWLLVALGGGVPFDSYMNFGVAPKPGSEWVDNLHRMHIE